MIKILHVVFSLEPGGMENGLVNVASKLPADEFKIDVCCLETKGAFANRLPDESKVLVLNKAPGKSVSTIAKLATYVALTKPNVIHTHDLGPLIYASWATAGGTLAPILHGEHCEIFPNERTPAKLRQRKRYYRTCKEIHSVSPSLTAHLNGLFGNRRIHTITNGVDAERFTPNDSPNAKKQFGFAPNTLVIGVVGRFAKRKRQMDVINAFLQMAESHPNLGLILPGDGTEKKTAQNLAMNSTFANRIVIPGFMEKPEDAYHAMDVLLMPSTLEGLSNAILEAMACGIPAIAHYACGCQDVIVHDVNGLLINLDNDEKLTKTLTELANGVHDLRRLGNNARKTILEKHSLQTMTDEYADLYRVVAGKI